MNYSPNVLSIANPDELHESMEITPDVDNPVYDLLVQDEELEAAGKQCFDDLEHMMQRISGLDESHPAFEPLAEVVNSQLRFHDGQEPAFDSLSRASCHTYIDSLEAIKSLNNHQFASGAAWLVALGGIGVTVATGLPGVAATGAVIGSATSEAVSEIRKTRGYVDKYLEFAAGIHGSREEFDTVYARMVLGEDSEPDDSLEV